MGQLGGGRSGSGSGAAFPVVFFDGDRETEIGTVGVDASLGFRKFQELIAHRVRVAPHQISISLVRRKKARASPEIRRKVPIDELSDFAAIARERDCFILAVLRRSRRERRGRPSRGGDGVSGKTAPPPERTILKRNLAGSVPDAAPLGTWGPESLIRAENMLKKFQKERYRITDSYHPYTTAMTATERHDSPAAAVCDGCAREEGFHRFVHDAVKVGFRTPAGPIQLPSKSRP